MTEATGTQHSDRQINATDFQGQGRPGREKVRAELEKS